MPSLRLSFYVFRLSSINRVARTARLCGTETLRRAPTFGRSLRQLSSPFGSRTQKIPAAAVRQAAFPKAKRRRRQRFEIRAECPRFRRLETAPPAPERTPYARSGKYPPDSPQRSRKQDSGQAPQAGKTQKTSTRRRTQWQRRAYKCPPAIYAPLPAIREFFVKIPP